MALSAPLMASANADMASQGLVGRAGAGGLGGGGCRQHPTEWIEGVELGRGWRRRGGAMGTGQFHNCEAGGGLAPGGCNTADQKFSTCSAKAA